MERSTKQARSPNQVVWDAGISLKRLLVPTDLSEQSGKALLYAAAFVQQFHCTIYVLLVVEAAPFAAGVEALPITLDREATVASGQRDLARWFGDLGWPNVLTTVPLVREGKLVPEIVAVATEQNIDLIIVSTHGRRGVKHLLLGSSAEEILRSAPCPVLVVREKEHEFLHSLPSQQAAPAA